MIDGVTSDSGELKKNNVAPTRIDKKLEDDDEEEITKFYLLVIYNISMLEKSPVNLYYYLKL